MPGENVQDWSVTAANNANSDSSINWAEGQPRASVNNSARAMMAAHAKDRDLHNGSIVTGGTADAQTFASGVNYIAPIPTGLRVLLKIGPGLTNTGAATLEMDGLGEVAIQTAIGGALVGGELIADTYCEFIYNGTNWRIIVDLSSKVSKAGDTMTGPLTTTALTATGSVTAGSVTTAGAVNAGSVAVSGSIVLPNVGTGVSVGNMQLIDNGSSRDLTFAGPNYRLMYESATGILRYLAAGVSAQYLLPDGSFYISTSDGRKVGGGPWNDISDARIKTVVGNYTTGLSEVSQMRPVRYTFKGNDTLSAPGSGETAPYADSLHYRAATSGQEFIGVVAQEVEQYLPELVVQNDGYVDGAAVTDLRNVDATALAYALVNSVKELLARIEALEAKVP